MARKANPYNRKPAREGDSAAQHQAGFAFISICIATALEVLAFWPDFVDAYAVPKLVATLIGGAVLLPQICILMRDRSRTFSSRGLLMLFGLQIAILTWSTAVSISPPVSFWGGDWRRMGWLTHVAMMIVAVGVPLAIGSDFKRWKQLLTVIALIGVICSLYGILQYVGWDPLLPASAREQIIAQFGGRYRSPSTIGQSTYFGTLVLYPFFASLALIFCENRWAARFVAIATSVVTGAALVFAAAARASILGGVVGAGLFSVWGVLFRLRGKPQRMQSVWGASILVVVVLVGIVGYLAGTAWNIGTDSEATGRILVWQDVIHSVLPRVWLHGAGPGMFRVSFAQYRSPTYGLFGPDVHWETAHNIILDRLTEQGAGGLLAFAAMVAVFFINIAHVMRFSFGKARYAYAAVGAGGIAALISSQFSGEVISTTYFLYLWVAISFAARGCVAPAGISYQVPRHGQIRTLSALLAVAGSLGSLGLLWYAGRAWHAESLLTQSRAAAQTGDKERFFVLGREAGTALPGIGTYDVEFAEWLDILLQDNRSNLDQELRRRFVEAGISAGLHAVDASDRPMLGLLHLVSFGAISSDSRTQFWLEELKRTDPYWFRPHELSARLLVSQRRFDEALREVTIAHQLAPYVDSVTSLWRELLALSREKSPAGMPRSP